MIPRKRWKCYYQDDLVIRVMTNDKPSKIISQRKRLPKDTDPFVLAVAKEYLKSTFHAVKFIKEKKNLNLTAALSYLDELRQAPGIRFGHWKECD